MSSRVINTILNLKDEMTQKLQAPLMSVRKLKREYENTKKELERYEDAQTKASQMLEQAKNKMEEVKKAVLNSSQAYQDNVKSLDRLKAKNEEIKASINRHESELSGLQSSYNENKRAYDNAKNTLVELKRQYGDNSQEIKEQERILQSLEREYNSSKSAYDNAKKSMQALKEEERTNTTTIKAQSKALESLKETLLNNSTAVKLAQRNITRYTQAEKEAGEKAKEARQKISQLSSEVAKNKKKFDDAKKTVKGWRDSAISSIDDVVKKMGQLTAVAVTATGGFALKTGLETAFNLEAYRTQLETATKDTEKTTKLIRKAQELSIATPFTPEEAIQSTAKMEALGVDSEKWLKMVADMAGATNKEMEQATDALIDMLSKQEFEGIEEFGINKEMIMAKAMIFLSSVISAVKIVFATLNVLLLNPAFLTIAGIILAVVVVGYVLYKCFKLIVGVVKICWDKFKEFGEYMPEWAKLLLLPLAPILAIIKGFKLIIDGAGKAWKWIKGFFSADEEKNVKINKVTEQELLSNDDVEKSVFNNKIDDFDNKKSPFDNINKAEMLKNDVAKVEKNNNVTDVKSQTIVKNIEPQITINVNGDVYGYNDFEEKVAGVFKNIIKYNMQNVT